MSVHENPFDETVWDPEDPEQAIEDPFHGPSSVFGRLSIPPMPLGDGTYYQPGGFDAFGTTYIDANGQPVHKLEVLGSMTGMQETQELVEWIEAAEQGEEALIELEARRQAERLDDQGFAQAFRTSDICAGGKKVSDCETASSMFNAAREYSESHEGEDVHSEGITWSTLGWLSKRCGDCALTCEVAIKHSDGKPTEEVRFTNSRPLEGIPTINIDIST